MFLIKQLKTEPKVMIDIMRRCVEEPHLCGAPRKQILDKEGGIWSNELNPFADHFKVIVFYFFIFARLDTGFCPLLLQ